MAIYNMTPAERNAWKNKARKGLATVGDFLGNMATGAVKGAESIADLGIGAVGEIGGLFNSDFRDKARKAAAYDFTGNVLGDKLTKVNGSYLKDGGAGENLAKRLGTTMTGGLIPSYVGDLLQKAYQKNVPPLFNISEEQQQKNMNAVKDLKDAGLYSLANFGVGAVKGVEDLVDTGIGIGGAIGGIWNKNIQDKAKKAIAYDWTQKNLGDRVEKLKGDKDSKAVQTAEKVSKALGREAIPLIGSLLTGGTSAIPYLATSALRTTGKGLEEAYGNGADYIEGLLQGASKGGVDLLTRGSLVGLSKNLLKNNQQEYWRRALRAYLGK